MSKDPKTVAVLGGKYTIIKDKTLQDCDGYCKRYKHEIRFRPAKMMLDGKGSTKEEKQSRKREVLRHELFHAFFNEAGLDKYGYDEALVTCLASMFPKILDTFESLHCER